jgi:hypothetical protein
VIGKLLWVGGVGVLGAWLGGGGKLKDILVFGGKLPNSRE